MSVQMKCFCSLTFFFTILLTSCKGGEPPSPYVYNTNPHYTWGYIEYFGPEYASYGITNNILSVSLFSDSLGTDSTGVLIGTGQVLSLEDVYVAPNERTLQTGTYTINSSGLPNTVSPGKNDTVGTEVFPIGATISYYEENASRSKMMLVTDGTFTVTKSGNNFTVICDLKTDDQKMLKGSFTGSLKYYDESLTLRRVTKLRKVHP
jgi:hypothetical protein